MTGTNMGYESIAYRTARIITMLQRENICPDKMEWKSINRLANSQAVPVDRFEDALKLRKMYLGLRECLNWTIAPHYSVQNGEID